jgi:hypothetical protein
MKKPRRARTFDPDTTPDESPPVADPAPYDDVPPSVIDAALPDLFDVAGFDPTVPRDWVAGFLRDTMADLPGETETTAKFLRTYDRSPRLAALAAGSRCEQEAFVLVVATLVEELCRPTRTRFEQLARDAGGLQRTYAVAVNALLDGLLAYLRTHGHTVPPQLTARIERTLVALKFPIPSNTGGRTASRVDSLTHALAFALRHVDGLRNVSGLIAQVLNEWMGVTKTSKQVRRLGYGRAHRRHAVPACAAALVPAIAVATPVAAFLTVCGRLAPIGPHAACGPPVPGISVGSLHVDAPTIEQAQAQRAAEIRGLLQHGLFPLPVQAGEG